MSAAIKIYSSLLLYLFSFALKVKFQKLKFELCQIKLDIESWINRCLRAERTVLEQRTIERT